MKHLYVIRCEEYWGNAQDTLMPINCKKGSNNEQLEAVIEHHELEPKE